MDASYFININLDLKTHIYIHMHRKSFESKTIARVFTKPTTLILRNKFIHIISKLNQVNLYQVNGIYHDF